MSHKSRNSGDKPLWFILAVYGQYLSISTISMDYLSFCLYHIYSISSILSGGNVENNAKSIH